MKIHPPTPEIPADNPFQHCAFARQKFAQALTLLIEQAEDPLVVCVDAPWGEGKTTFAKMWRADLLKRDRKTIYYDAFADDFAGDPFVAFCSEIQTFMSAQPKQNSPLAARAKRFGKTAADVGRHLLPNVAAAAFKAAAKAMTGGAAGEEPLAELGADTAKSVVENLLKQRTSEKKALSSFKEELLSVGGAVREAQTFPLLVIVDELDRCRPDYALTLIERIKHLFSVPGVVFVLLANLNQLESQVRAVYGSDVDARNYLLKFFTITTKLPKDVLDPDYNHYSKYLGVLERHYDLHIDNQAGQQLVRLLRRYSFSLREMESLFASLKLAAILLPMHNTQLAELSLLLGVLRMKRPGLFADLAIAPVSLDDFLRRADMRDVNIDTDSQHKDAYLVLLLRYFLLSDAEVAALPEDDRSLKSCAHLQNRFRDRRGLIPSICQTLDRFEYVH